MKPKSYTVEEVYKNSELSFIFEFYSSRDVIMLSKDLSKVLGKQVTVTSNETFQPTYTTSILYKEYDGDNPRYQLKTGTYNFNNLNPTFNTLLMWLNEYASLNFSTNLRTTLSFNHRNLQTIKSISNMDPGKMVLKINEEYLYEKFPEGINSPFSMSIKKLIPSNHWLNAAQTIHSITNNFNIPMEQYYGVNFENYSKGLLEFNYIIGSDYTEKPKEILEVLQYYILTTYQCLNEVQ